MMEEPKKAFGRPQVYNGEISDLAKRMEDRRKADAGTAGQPERQAGESLPGMDGSEKTAPPAKRKREQENNRKLQSLKVVLGVLILALIAALIYEVGLGHGTKQSHNERVQSQLQTAQYAQGGAAGLSETADE